MKLKSFLKTHCLEFCPLLAPGIANCLLSYCSKIHPAPQSDCEEIWEYFMHVFCQINADEQFQDIQQDCGWLVKALLDAVLKTQLCVRAMSAQIDLNCCDSLNMGIHPHPSRSLGVESFLSCTSAVPAWLSGAPEPASDLACYCVLPDDPWTGLAAVTNCAAQVPLAQWGCASSMESLLSSPWAALGSWLPCPKGAELPHCSLILGFRVPEDAGCL